VGRVLEAPFDLAIAWIHGEHARSPFVVAGPVFGVVIRAGVADALVDGVGVLVVGGRHPDRPAAVLPVVLAILPGLMAGLAHAWNRVRAPRLLAGVEVGGVDPAADAEFAPGRSDDGEIADDQRRHRHRFAHSRLSCLAFPYLFAGGAVEGEDAPV